MNAPDPADCIGIKVATQAFMVESGHEDPPAFCVYISRYDGEEIAMQVLTLANLANLFAVLQPPEFILHCGCEEREDDLRSDLRALVGDNVVLLH